MLATLVILCALAFTTINATEVGVSFTLYSKGFDQVELAGQGGTSYIEYDGTRVTIDQFPGENQRGIFVIALDRNDGSQIFIGSYDAFDNSEVNVQDNALARQLESLPRGSMVFVVAHDTPTGGGEPVNAENSQSLGLLYAWSGCTFDLDFRQAFYLVVEANPTTIGGSCGRSNRDAPPLIFTDTFDFPGDPDQEADAVTPPVGATFAVRVGSRGFNHGNPTARLDVGLAVHHIWDQNLFDVDPNRGWFAVAVDPNTAEVTDSFAYDVWPSDTQAAGDAAFAASLAAVPADQRLFVFTSDTPTGDDCFVPEETLAALATLGCSIRPGQREAFAMATVVGQPDDTLCQREPFYHEDGVLLEMEINFPGFPPTAT